MPRSTGATEFLDKELQKLSSPGRPRAVDKLVRVWRRSGSPARVFAIAVMAHLKTQATQGDPGERARWKLTLSRMLLERGWSRHDMLDLYKFIDWLMALPEDLQRQHEESLEEEKMTHLTVWERRGIEQGLKEGEERGGLRQARRAVVRALELRFEDVPNPVRERIEAVTELDRLETLLDQAIKAESLAAFCQGLRDDLANR